MQLPKLPSAIIDFKPEIGLVLGSGLNFFADDRIETKGYLDYCEIEKFPVATVPGHAGRFVYGHIGGRRVICMQGRFHFYEGYTMHELAMPILLMAGLGVQCLFLTNAAGGINQNYRPGDFMLIRDHINFLGMNPLVGLRSVGGVRFPDMSAVYDRKLRARIREWAKLNEMDLKEGVYLATVGPCFETPSEIRAFANLGADAVGMSTVPEAIVARQQGLQVIGFSCITNTAASLLKGPISHEEVLETADRMRPAFANLLEAAITLAD